MRGGRAPQGTAVDIDALAIDVRTRDQRVVSEIGGLIHARFGGSAAARSITRIIDDEQRCVGRPEIPDYRPEGGDRLTVAVERQKSGGGGGRGAAGGEIPSHGPG